MEHDRPSRLLIVGMGGIGGWLGARLLESGAQNAEVAFIVRGEHAAAIRAKGLQLEVGGSNEAVPTSVLYFPPATMELYSTLKEAEESSVRLFDYVILAVKSWQVADAAKEAVNLLAPGGCMVTTQNGLEAPRKVAEVIGYSNVLGGSAKGFSYIKEPGVIRVVDVNIMEFGFGEVYNNGMPILPRSSPHINSERTQRLATVFARCKGIEGGEAKPGAWRMIWKKAVLMCGVGPISALCRAPLDVLLTIPECKGLLKRAILEVAECAKAAGYCEEGETPDGIADDSLVILRCQVEEYPGVTSSTLRDVACGRPSEAVSLTGSVVRAGLALGVPTPTHDMLLAALLPQELLARGEIAYNLMGVPNGSPFMTM